jgi:hypothetical protein
MVAKLVEVTLSTVFTRSIEWLSSAVSRGDCLFLASAALDMMDLVTLAETMEALVFLEIFFCEAE